MDIAVKQLYTSVACNRTPEIVDWNDDGLICFGASYAVVIYDTNEKDENPISVYHHHTCTVNSVKWLKKNNRHCVELVSCSADKTAAVWTLSVGRWEVTSKLTGHEDGVTCIDGVYTNDGGLMVYTSSIDSTVKIWESSNGSTNLKQTISLNSGLCLTLHAQLLPMVKKPLLFCALDDHKIHIFAGEDEYHRVQTLVGHDDWVRGMDALSADGSLLLASCSQDTHIRLWRVHPYEEAKLTSKIKVEEKHFDVYGVKWSVNLETVLSGHEGWVYGVQWHPHSWNEEKNCKEPVYRLLSSSLDKALILWEADESGVWAERARLGEVGGGGLGFYGARLGPNGQAILGHGYNGSFHLWTLSEDTNQWQPAVVFGGHYQGVEDICWEPQGRFLTSVSLDQTTRLHAPWKRIGHKPAWYEIARPQVHGYDMASIAMVDSITFASAAEEKVIRVFKAPYNFLQNYKNIVGEELVEDSAAAVPQGASVPSLGLSNKAFFGDAKRKNEEEEHILPVNLSEPPSEECLMQSLWPETHKLYGHGYEARCVRTSRDGCLLASAGRAPSADHADVLLWETTSWKQIQKLKSHTLTISQMEFSPDSRRLVSVSRDRRWTVYHRRTNSELFDVVATTDKSNGVHTRIIWCCAWAHNSSVFATGSRDGKVCVWTKGCVAKDTSIGEYELVGTHLALENSSVTAVAIAPVAIGKSRIVAVGLEAGNIHLYEFNGAAWRLLKEIDTSDAHHLTVKKLAFQPTEKPDLSRLLLASCGGDHFVRIHQINVSLCY